MEPDLINEFVPGDAQLQGIAPAYNAMVNEDLTQDMGTPFVGGPGPDLKKIAGTAARNILTNEAIKALGMEGLKGNIFKGLMTGSALGNPLSLSNPITAAFTFGSALPNSVKGIAGLLRGKRAEKAIARDIIRDNQGADMPISPAITNMPVSAKDKAMGGGNIPSKTSTSAPKSSGATSNPYGGGAGGIHSY